MPSTADKPDQDRPEPQPDAGGGALSPADKPGVDQTPPGEEPGTLDSGG